MTFKTVKDDMGLSIYYVTGGEGGVLPFFYNITGGGGLNVYYNITVLKG